VAQEIGIREVLEQISARFNSLEGRFNSLEARVEARFDRIERAIEDLRSEVHTNFRWTMGVILTAWAMVVAAVLGALLAGS